MPRKPAQHFKPWTPDEITTLLRLVSEGASYRSIAKELGRTTASVEQRAGIERRARQVQPPPDPHAPQA